MLNIDVVITIATITPSFCFIALAANNIDITVINTAIMPQKALK